MTATRSAPDGVPTTTPAEGSLSARAGGAAKAAGSGSAAGPAGRLGPKSAGTRSGGRTITVGIVGATGYAGGELVRLLLRHPNVRLAGLYGRNRNEEPIAASHPHLAATGLVIDRAIPEADAIFTALPHGAAAGDGRRDRRQWLRPARRWA